MNVAVAGAGKMGGEIFRLLARSPLDVTLYARNAAQAGEHERKCLKDLRRSARRGTITRQEAESRRKRLRVTDNPADLAAADLVVEAITEDFDRKAAFFKQIEGIVRPDAVLVSNSSSLSIERMGSGLRYPGRFCGLHFFHPAALIRLVEIIFWSGSSKELRGFLRDFCGGISRIPIEVRDGPGSVINSILAYYYTEALYILEEGQAVPSKVDALARTFCSLGPCESADAVGIDLFVRGLRNTTAMGGLFGTRAAGNAERLLTRDECAGRGGFHVPYLFQVLLAANRLGRKTSAGLYRYDGDRPVDDRADFYVDPSITRGPVERQADDVLSRRLLYAILNGALYSLRAGSASAADLDRGMKEVLLMERGPFELMEVMGEERVRHDFDMLAGAVGARFRQESGWLSWR